MQRALLMLIGCLAIGLAMLGLFLPILPTTPFLLLAAWCFSRSSTRWHNWLLHRSWFSQYLSYWQQHRALPPNVKSKAIILTLISFGLSLWLVSLWWVRAILIVILVMVLCILYRLPVNTCTQRDL